MRPRGGASRWWLHHSLAALTQSIEKAGVNLHILRGAAGELVPAIAKAANAGAVYWTRRYDAAGIAVDRQIKQRLREQNVEARSFNGQLLFEPWEIETKSATPYGVFTPFWKSALAKSGLERPLPRVTKIINSAWPRNAPDKISLEELELLPTKPDWAGGLRKRWTPGEAGARQRLKTFLDGPLANYTSDRDRPDRDATSFLSPHLAFGEISPRTIWHAVQHRIGEQSDIAAAGHKFLSEIGWREFSYHLLFFNPDLATNNYNGKFDNFAWREPNAATRNAWTQGRTGVPIVDAGMRELWQTGYMHNRVRMIVASFLVKNLLIDWREGERWFWDTLCDADPANNAAGWQWVAGSGADAAPYFRIFNPVLQGEKYDPNGEYVRAYVPEIAGLPDKLVHKPWDAPTDLLKTTRPQSGVSYPEPLVDLKVSRERALEAFRALGTR